LHGNAPIPYRATTVNPTLKNLSSPPLSTHRLPFSDNTEYIVKREFFHTKEEIDEKPQLLSQYKQGGYQITIDPLSGAMAAIREDFQEQTIKRAILEKNLRPIFSSVSDCPKFLKELIKQCWRQTPDQRPTMDTIVQILEGEYASFKTD